MAKKPVNMTDTAEDDEAPILGAEDTPAAAVEPAPAPVEKERAASLETPASLAEINRLVQARQEEIRLQNDQARSIIQQFLTTGVVPGPITASPAAAQLLAASKSKA